MKLQPALKDTRKDKLFQKGFDYHKLRTVPSPQAILPEIDEESRHKSFYFFFLQIIFRNWFWPLMVWCHQILEETLPLAVICITSQPSFCNFFYNKLMRNCAVTFIPPGSEFI